MSNLEELEKKYIELGEEIQKEIEKHKKGEGKILVPNCITLIGTDSARIGIGIALGKQELCYSFSDNIWIIKPKANTERMFKLVKCDYDDLAIGEAYYTTNDPDPLADYEDLDYYFIKLRDNKSISWNRNNGEIEIDKWDNDRNVYYKVVQI